MGGGTRFVCKGTLPWEEMDSISPSAEFDICYHHFWTKKLVRYLSSKMMNKVCTFPYYRTLKNVDRGLHMFEWTFLDSKCQILKKLCFSTLKMHVNEEIHP